MRLNRMWMTVIFASSLGGAGCSSKAEHVDADLKVTITQGVYGELGLGCDTSDCSSSAASGRALDVLSEAPKAGKTPAVLKSTTSDGTGFYQVEIAPGSYFLSIGTEVNGTDVTVPMGLVRCDWESGPGGGFWDCVNKK